MIATQVTSVIQDLKEALLSRYGNHLRQVILFGSQARGTAVSESDIAVLAIIDPPGIDVFQEYQKWGDWITETLMESGELVNLLFTTPGRYESVKSPLYLNIRKEGIVVFDINARQNKR